MQSADVSLYLSIAAAMLIVGGGMLALSLLRLPPNERDQLCRWSRHAAGTPVSRLSIMAWAGSMSGYGIVALLIAFHQVPAAASCAGFSGIAGVILFACWLRDTREAKR